MPAKKELLKWDRVTICREFGMDSRTVGKRLADADLDGKDKFSTKEVFSAMQGDLSAERIRETRERADKLALENAEKRGELVDVQTYSARIGNAIQPLRQRILSDANLEDTAKDKLLLDLRGLLAAALGANTGEPDPAATLPS